MGTSNLTEQQQAMFRLVEQGQSSDVSKKEFCRQHDLPEWKFYYWQNRYRDHHRPEGFVPVKVGKDKKASTGLLEIHYPNGVVLHLPKDSSLSVIRTLIGLL